MKITKIEVQKKNIKRFSIYIDSEFSLGIHEDVLIKCNLYVNKVIDTDYIETIVKTEEQSKANHYAINLLSYRVRSKHEILTKMTEKDYDLDIINNTIDFLTDNHLLNDLEFARMFIRDKLNLTRYSILRIRHDLRNKGVDKQLINEALLLIEDDELDPDYDNAKYLSLKKYNDLKSKKKNIDLSEYEIKQKVYSAISQKGFNIYIIKDALEDALKEENESSSNM